MCKVIVSRDVSFNKSGLLKERYNSKAPRTDKETSSVIDVVVKEFDHYVTDNLSQD